MRVLQRWVGVTSIGALVALAGSCAPHDGGNGTVGAESLRDRTFLLQSSEGFQPVTGTTVRLHFTENEASFNAGCNYYGGPCQLSGGVLSFSGLNRTLIGCDGPSRQRDEWLVAFMTSWPRLTLAGNDLTLRSPTATLVFLDRVVADPDRPLVGTPWTVDRYLKDGSVSGFFLDGAPGFVFGADGRVDVDTTCNTGVGTFVLEGTKLTLTGMTYTTNACPEGSQRTAAQYLRSVLATGETTVKIVAAELTLTRADLGVEASAP